MNFEFPELCQTHSKDFRLLTLTPTPASNRTSPWPSPGITRSGGHDLSDNQKPLRSPRMPSLF